MHFGKVCIFFCIGNVYLEVFSFDNELEIVLFFLQSFNSAVIVTTDGRKRVYGSFTNEMIE